MTPIRLFPAMLALLCAGPLHADVIEIFPGQSFELAAENLSAGDTLIVHEGEYTLANRIAITAPGTAQNPVLIKGADGEARPVIRLTASGHNTIDISGATYLTIRGLEITAPGIGGADGINLNSNPAHITIEDNVIHDVSVGVNLRSSMQHITVRRNEIYDTNDTGEGMYVGCHTGSCVVSDSVFEQNHIHHTNGSLQGDGIEIKKNSHSNIIRDNVIHDTYYPCIILYGSGGGGQNIVERNVVWNCGDSGIQVAADTIVRNNIFMPGTGQGISSQSSNGVVPNNLQVVHNTFVSSSSTCLRLNGWDNKTNMVFANNAVYCAGANFVIGSLTGVTVTGNVSEGTISGLPSSGYQVGRSRTLDLIDAANRNVYPSSDSALLGAGNAAYVTGDDFNGTARSGAIDAGAYDWTGNTNPGWTVTADFKDADPAPVVTLTADATALEYNGGTTLRWTSSGASSCAASGDWAGPKALTGSEGTGALLGDADYQLRCQNGAGAQTLAAVSITVQDPATPPPPEPEPQPEPQPEPAPDPDPAVPPSGNPGAGDDPASAPGVTETGASSSGSALGLLSLLLMMTARRRRA